MTLNSRYQLHIKKLMNYYSDTYSCKNFSDNKIKKIYEVLPDPVD